MKEEPPSHFWRGVSDPELSQVELDLLFVELHYGKDLADRVRADLKRRKEES
jgi:hypothetical protein